MLDKIIEEAMHSYQHGTLTSEELNCIMKIVEHAKTDLEKHDGNRSKNAHKIPVKVLFGYMENEND